MRSSLATLALTWLLLTASLRAQGDPPEPKADPGGWLTGGDEEEEAPESREAKTDGSATDFQRPLDLQRRGKWKAAQKTFRDLIEKFPNSPHRASAEARSDHNAFLGCEVRPPRAPHAR